jgi:hypothetical protein
MAARRRPQLPLPGIEPGHEPIEIEIPTMGWEQIGGDVDPGAHGGIIATGDGHAIELLKIQPVREYVGDKEAAEVGFPFWTRTAYFDMSDLDLKNNDVQSAMQSVGLNLDALEDMKPTQRALALAEALLQWGRGDEGEAGWSDDIGIPTHVKWWDGKVAGAEYLADEDDAFRDDVLGYADIRSAVEVKVQEMADQSSAQAWSTLGDQVKVDLAEAGFDAESAVAVAEFGDAVAVNGDLEPEKTLADVEGELESEGYERTDFGGRIPTDEAEVSAEHVVEAVAKELGRSEEDVQTAAKGLDWWAPNIAWSSSGDGDVWAKRAGENRVNETSRRRGKRGTPTKPTREASAGFAITVYGQRTLEDFARDTFGPNGDAADREEATRAGLVDANGEITQRGWDQLSDDIGKIEDNSLAWMRQKFLGASDQGHDGYDDLVGNVRFDPTNVDQAALIDLGTKERIDMVDTSFGDLGDSALNGVSSFGGRILGGHVTFFDVQPEDMEVVQQTLAGARKQRKGPTQTGGVRRTRGGGTRFSETNGLSERRAALDPLAPIHGNGVAYFDVDGDPESLDIRAGEVPVDVVVGYMQRRLNGGSARRGDRPGEVVVDYVGPRGEPGSFTTRVKVQSRSGGKRASEVSERRHPDMVAAGDFRVAYLGAGARRTHLEGSFSRDGAIKELNRLKRLGRTAWIEDGAGNFVPVPGATRRPSFRELSERRGGFSRPVPSSRHHRATSRRRR